LLAGLLQVGCIDGYDKAHTVNCRLIDDSWSLDQNLSYMW
jgi:hypothetical protein